MQAHQFNLRQAAFLSYSVSRLSATAHIRARVNSTLLTVLATSFRLPQDCDFSALIMGKNALMLLGGHRGMGENLVTRCPDGRTVVYPAFRENTIQSFKQAAKCGVSFVEFDVQVTRDNVPVIWHDDDVYFGSADHPNRLQVKDFTVDELKALCGRQAAAATTTKAFPTTNSSNSSSCTSDYNIFAGSGGDHDAMLPAGSSPSGSSVDEEQSQEPQSQSLLRLFRDRATRQNISSFKQWKCEKDDFIPTLEAVFEALPLEIGFDIEIKMTTGDDVVHTPSEEIERMLTAILPIVHRCAASPAHSQRRRRIMFSSFDPDVCVELKRRQFEHPVFYLSGCGLYKHVDARRTSIPAALSFAEEEGMQGLVVPASVLLKNMDMVERVHRSHLELMTYGLENNDLDSLKTQADAGVVAAIVDDVEHVAAALNRENGAAESVKQAADQTADTSDLGEASAAHA